MSDFDYDKIKDMKYDPDRERYVGEDGSELKVTPFKNGSGYKYDYYDKITYGNSKHNSTHLKSDLNENWERTDNDRDNGTQERSSGSGCYLTTACMKHMEEKFDDKCKELMLLRWFRDKFVSREDIEHYYQTAPIIVEALDNSEECNSMYEYIYNNVISACVKAIENGDYDFAYSRYKNNIIALEEQYAKPMLRQKLIRTIKLCN